MTYTLGGVSYVVSYQINRTTRTIAQHWEGTAGSTNPSYVNNSRFFPYQLAVKSMNKVPDTGQTISATTTFGEDSDYTINAPSFTDNGNGTITDNITGLMWQKTDSGEMTWDNAVATALTLNLGGSVDWRLPTPMEAFSILIGWKTGQKTCSRLLWKLTSVGSFNTLPTGNNISIKHNR